MPENNPKDKSAGEEVTPADFNTITVIFTFEGYEPWVFKFRRQLSREVKKLKEDFFALTKEQQKEKVIPHRISQLAHLLQIEPVNVPDYPLLKNRPTIKGSEKEQITANFIEFFTREENEEYVGWIWGNYQGKLYPKELL